MNNVLNKNLSIKKFNSPFNYIIIDDLFTDQQYNEIVNNFHHINNNGNKYLDYSAIIRELKKEDIIKYNLNFFISDAFKNTISYAFDIKLSNYMTISTHLHKYPSKDGWWHTDFNMCSFIKNDSFPSLTTQNYLCDTNDCDFNEEKVIRSVVFIYYLNNKEHLGGGTAVSEDTINFDLIEPKNNRLFIFEISPKSYHKYVAANFDRSTIIGWFHSNPSYLIYRYSENKTFNTSILARWPQPQGKDLELWDIKNKDPEYRKYFKK